MIKLYILLAIITVALAAPSVDSEGLLSRSIRFVKDCGDKSITLCFKVRVWIIMNKFWFI